MEEALISQRLEFMELQLEQSRRRESNLQEMNASLMRAMSSDQPLKDHTVQELQRTNQKHVRDLQDLKKRFKKKQASLQQQIRELSLVNKQLSLDLKQNKVQWETQKFEMVAKVQRLQNQKQALEKKLEFQQEGFQYGQKLKEFNRDFDFQKGKIIIQTQKEANSTIQQLRTIFNKENEALRAQNSALQLKVRGLHGKVDFLKQRSQSSLKYSFVSQDLEAQDSVLDMSQWKKKTKKVYAETSRRNNTERDQLLQYKDREIAQLSRLLQTAKLQKDKIQVQLDRAVLDLKQQKLENALNNEKWMENERGLKNQIKFLIGKLLKAKTKLNIEGELNETWRNGMMTTMRNRSRPRAAISPLDLSVISRSDSSQSGYNNI